MDEHDIDPSGQHTNKDQDITGRTLNGEEAWNAKEGEITPEHTRRLGHLLYVTMFKDRSILGSISDHRVPSDPESLPGEQWVDAFAHKYKLDTKITKRWAHNASKEIAQACFSVKKRWHDEAVKRGGSSDHFEHDTRGILSITQKGIEAPIEAHENLVNLAVDINLGPDFSLHPPYHPRGPYS